MIMTTPKQEGYFMPGEWHPHTACWMAWPCAADAFSRAPMDLETAHKSAKKCWAEVANAVSRFEPLYMLTNKEDLGETKSLCGPDINIIETELDDGWFRDSGPSFVINKTGDVAGVNWIFNGWGNRGPHERDNRAAGFVLDRMGIKKYDSPLVLEGGGIHVDGEGTVLLTESVQLNKNRNPELSKNEVENYLREYLNVEKIIWLCGDRNQTSTDGHVDAVASFIRPGRILLGTSNDTTHPDYETFQKNREILENNRDAQGRAFEIVEITEPYEILANGTQVKGIYVNFYMANNGIVMPKFDFPKYDQAALDIFTREFPDREIVQVSTRMILFGGGNIHCITQQQPAPNQIG
ncbi:MAG: agmatine deiminase [Deltaproteobacteria bacterium]|nr:MAG: agmatine deiminase [Deltaproteobacteria bacterium]RLC22201.1 MAG: agmatine deiminase [Deltaproteobacteria bacterium]